MNKFLMIGAAGISLALGANSVEVQAGPFDKLKSTVKKVKKKTKEAERTAQDVSDTVDAVDAVSKGRVPSRSGFANRGSTSNSPRTAKGKPHAGRAGPAPASLTGLTKCANIKMTNVMIGQVSDYTFSEGLQQEKRSGFVNRESVKPNGCIVPSMGTYDYLYLEVDKKQYEAMGNSNAWEVQCVESATKKAAASPQPYTVNVMAGKDLMLHCGNSEGISPCATGSNSSRSGAWDRELKKRGKTMLSINMPNYHQDSGTDFYCQYYNKTSGKSMFAFQYRRSAGNR